MEIKRDQYLNALKNRMHNGMIKVITGIRRAGKSYILFNIFQNHLLSIGVNPSQIITIEFDRYENRKYRNPDFVLEYIHSCDNVKIKFTKMDRLFFTNLDRII